MKYIDNENLDYLRKLLVTKISDEVCAPRVNESSEFILGKLNGLKTVIDMIDEAKEAKKKLGGVL